jgi:hypothetical protein
VIGYTDLEYRMPPDRAAGVFRPAHGYASIRRIFALYHPHGRDRVRLQAYVDARDQLQMVITDGGTLPFAARVELISEWSPVRKIVHVSMKDERFWRQGSVSLTV